MSSLDITISLPFCCCSCCCCCCFLLLLWGIETGILVFLFRLLGFQFCCHTSITVWARKIFFLSGVNRILWKRFICPNFWHESDQVADITHVTLVITESVEDFVIDAFWDFVSISSSSERILCAGKDWTPHRKGLVKELNFVSSLTLFSLNSTTKKNHLCKQYINLLSLEKNKTKWISAYSMFLVCLFLLFLICEITLKWKVKDKEDWC